MGKSDLLRVHEVRDAYRLIGSCRDLGGDPASWQARMLEGLRRLIGAAAAIGGEGRLVGPDRQIVVPLSSVQSGLDAHGQKVLAAYLRDRGPAADAFIRVLRPASARLVTRTRRQIVSDAAYYRSLVFDKYLREAAVDHRIASSYQTLEGRTISMLHLQRGLGERDFSPRERRLLHFFHGELGPLIGKQLVSVAEPGPDRLSPRLRQTLACLVEGDSEKQAAARLGLSPATIHQYVTALYRRFGVRSRGQLLAHVVKRAGRAEWTGISAQVRPVDDGGTRGDRPPGDDPG
jgi:DNA-binding CsgD family transcriptional regulator